MVRLTTWLNWRETECVHYVLQKKCIIGNHAASKGSTPWGQEMLYIQKVVTLNSYLFVSSMGSVLTAKERRQTKTLFILPNLFRYRSCIIVMQWKHGNMSCVYLERGNFQLGTYSTMLVMQGTASEAMTHQNVLCSKHMVHIKIFMRQSPL